MSASRRSHASFLSYLIAFVFVWSAHASSVDITGNLTVEKISQMPLAFTENQGQWDGTVKFCASSGGATLWFTEEGVVYQFTRRIHRDNLRDDDPMPIHRSRLDQEPDSIEQLVIKESFVGANPNVEIDGEGLMEYQCNYFIGNDPSDWHTEVPNYSSVVYRHLYPGIDVRFFGDRNGKAAYELIAEPGADLNQVEVEYDGVDELSVDEDGRLIARTEWGDMIVVIEPESGEEPVASRGLMLTSEHTAGIETAACETQRPSSLALTLDYSTYLGGSGYDVSHSIAVDASGAAYVSGLTLTTESTNDFPTVNPYQGTYAGKDDVFVTKISSTGTSLVYSTYLGGIDDEDGSCIAVDGSGMVCVAGYTGSANFPTHNPYQGTFAGVYDAFVAMLSSSGSSLIYCTYLGGSDNDGAAGVSLDGGGTAYVIGSTMSADFPTYNPYQGGLAGGVDAFVTRLSASGNTLLYSSYLGGSDNDLGAAMAVDGFGYAYVAGRTSSTDFPTNDPYQGTLSGYQDAFVAKLSSAGSSLIYSTYLGGSSYEWALGISTYWFTFGNPPGWAPCVVGETGSTDFPVFSPYQATFQGGDYDAFVTKFSNIGSFLAMSTYLGGDQDDLALGVSINSSGEVYVAGTTKSTDFPTVNAYQEDEDELYDDAFVSKFPSSSFSPVYSTYLGGSYYDIAYAIAVDGSGSAYVTGYTFSTDFPTVNPYQTNQESADCFVSKLSLVAYTSGDTDGSGTVDIDDVVYLIAYIFSGGPAPDPVAAGDADCSGTVDIDDVVYLIAYIFAGGPPPGDPDGDGVPDC